MTRVIGGIIIKVDTQTVLNVDRILENNEAIPISQEVVPSFTST